MAAKETFSKRLKELRGGIPVKDLAARCGVATTVLYKAEGGEQTVSWKTVEKAYGDLCKSAHEYENLLMLWAITQSERHVGLYAAREAMTRVMDEEAREITAEHHAILREMETMPLPDQRDLVKFTRHFRQSPATRNIAKVWIRETGAK